MASMVHKPGLQMYCLCIQRQNYACCCMNPPLYQRLFALIKAVLIPVGVCDRRRIHRSARTRDVGSDRHNRAPRPPYSKWQDPGIFARSEFIPGARPRPARALDGALQLRRRPRCGLSLAWAGLSLAWARAGPHRAAEASAELGGQAPAAGLGVRVYSGQGAGGPWPVALSGGLCL